MVLDSRDKYFFAVLHQVVLDGPDLLQTRDVLVEARVDRHVLGSNCESLPVLVLRFDVQDERDAGRVVRHQLLNVLHVQVHPFNHDRLVALVGTLNYFGELRLH